jgi:hypothetical protein
MKSDPASHPAFGAHGAFGTGSLVYWRKMYNRFGCGTLQLPPSTTMFDISVLQNNPPRGSVEDFSEAYLVPSELSPDGTQGLSRVIQLYSNLVGTVTLPHGFDFNQVLGVRSPKVPHWFLMPSLEQGKLEDVLMRFSTIRQCWGRPLNSLTAIELVLALIRWKIDTKTPFSSDYRFVTPATFHEAGYSLVFGINGEGALSVEMYGFDQDLPDDVMFIPGIICGTANVPGAQERRASIKSDWTTPSVPWDEYVGAAVMA